MTTPTDTTPGTHARNGDLSSTAQSGDRALARGETPEPAATHAPGGGVLYKPGQGYWVRVLTAVGLALLFTAAAAWLWQQLSAFPLPRQAWRLTLTTDAQGEHPAAGQSVSLMSAARSADGQSIAVGAASVRSFHAISPSSAELVIAPPTLQEGYEVADVSQVVLPSQTAGAAPAFEAAVATTYGVPVFDQLYLQAGVAGLVLLIGAALIYWLVAVRPASVDFLVATDAEMKKVNWSTRKQIVDSTWVVVGACFLISGFLYGVDLLLQLFFSAIGVLQK